MIRPLACILILFAFQPAFALELQSAFPYELLMSDDQLKAILQSGLDTQRSESEEFKLYDRPEKASQFDRSILAKLLKAEGYYASRIKTKVENERIQHTVLPGELYRVKRIDLHFPKSVTGFDKTSLKQKEGKALKAADVLESEKQIKDFLSQNHCLFHIELNYNVKINDKTREAFVNFIVKDSPQVNFGEAQLVGQQRLKSDFLRTFFTFKQGDCFKRKEIELTRLKLLQSNLVARAEVAIAEPENGEVIVAYEITERKHRTVKFGLGYNGDTKARAMLGWQHRNTAGRGEILDVEFRTGAVEQGIYSKLKVPHFLEYGQTLEIKADYERENNDSYNAEVLDASAVISRALLTHWSASAGVAVEISDVEDENYELLSFPLALNYDLTDDRLNPRHGWTASLKIRPFQNFLDEQAQFTLKTFGASVYLSANSWFLKPTFAARIAVGSISAQNLDQVPHNHRLYVGGGGSVRGYAYKSLSELNEKNEAKGGLSSAEYSLELRFLLSKSWGLVLFKDGGYAYPGESPEFGENFKSGVGLGLRFFTSFAPIRFDVAAPLDRRLNELTEDNKEDYIDDPFQFYLSIGQAF